MENRPSLRDLTTGAAERGSRAMQEKLGGGVASSRGPSQVERFTEGARDRAIRSGKWLKDTFWSKEDRKAALITGSTIGLIRAGINWGTGGLGLAGSAGIGAIAGGGRAFVQDVYRQHGEQIAELKKRKQDAIDDASVVFDPDAEQRLQTLKDVKFIDIVTRYRAADKKRLVKTVIGGAAWGALGAGVGFEVKELGIKDRIGEFAAEHAGTTIGTLTGTATGLLLRLRKSRQGGEKFLSRKTILTTIAGGILGASVGYAAEGIVQKLGEVAGGRDSLTGSGTGVEGAATAVPAATIPQAEAFPEAPRAVESPVASPATSPAASPEVSRAVASPEPSPTSTSTPTRIPPTSTPTPSPTQEVSPQRPGLPTFEPSKPRPIGSLPGGIEPVAQVSNEDSIVPIGFSSSLIPVAQSDGMLPASVLAQAAPSIQNPEMDVSKLTQVRDINVEKIMEGKGADEYAIKLREVLEDPTNTEKLNPFNKDLPPVTTEGVANAEKDAIFKQYEAARASEALVSQAKQLASDRSNIDALNETAQTEYGQFQGAQESADDLEKWKGAVDAKGHRINEADISLARADAAQQAEEARSAIRNLEIVQNPVKYGPPPPELVPPEVRLGLPNFFDQEINIKPGSSFWNSWDIRPEYFADQTSDGWENLSNGVTQEDVIKDMITKFARENGKPIDMIKPGIFKLSGLDLSDEQKDAIRKALATRTPDQYLRGGGMSTFQAALKKAA